MDNIKSNDEITFLSHWSCEEMLTEFADQIFHEKIASPLEGTKCDDHSGFALNIEDGLEFAYIKCKMPYDITLMRSSSQNLDTLALYFFFDSYFDHIVENEREKNVQGLLNGILIHNYARSAMIPLSKGQEFSYVLIRINKKAIEKYFKLVSDKLIQFLFTEKPVLLYENLNLDILTYLNSIDRINSSKLISRYFIFSKCLALVTLAFDTLLEREKESELIDRIPGYEKVINARNYLLSDLQKIPTVKRLSRYLGMSETNAKMLFKQVFGSPVYKYFKRKKMEIAYQLINETDSDMVEIARNLGYQNPGQFSADFKKHFGVSPKKYSLHLKRQLS